MIWKPWTFFAVAIAGWMNRQQQEVIEYLRMENRILREKLGHKRIILNDSQRRRPTARMKHVGPEESLMKSSQLSRFESDALTDKISKPILSLLVELRRQIGRSRCSGGVDLRTHSVQEQRKRLYVEPIHSKPSQPRPFDLATLQLNCN